MPEPDNTVSYGREGEAAMAAPAAPGEPPLRLSGEPPLIRIHLRWDEDNHVLNITTTQPPLPTVAMVMAELSPAQRRILSQRQFRWQRDRLNQLIPGSREVIPLQAWSDAIAQATVKRLAAQRPEADSLISQNLQGAYMAMGDMLYRVSIVEALPAAKALPTLKRQLTERYRERAAQLEAEAQAQARRITEDASSAARAVIEQANQQKQEAQQLLQRARRESGVMPPPELRMGGVPLRWNEAQQAWEAGFHFLYKPARISLSDASGNLLGEWLPVPEASPVAVLLWQPFESEGGFVVTAAHMDGGSSELPHVSYGSACMAPRGLPPRVRSMAEYNQLQRAVVNCLNGGVELNSLLNRRWRSEVLALFPPDLRAAVVSGGGFMHLLDSHSRRPAEHEERSTVWNA